MNAVIDEQASEARPLPALGVHEDMSFDDYKVAPGINKSGLDNIARCPAYYQWMKNHPRPETAALAIGKAAHCLILTPDEFSAQYVRSAYTDFRTKEAREWRDLMAADGKTVLKTVSDDPDGNPSDWDTVHLMRDAVMAHPIASVLLTGGRPELSLFWQDSDREDATHRLCKGRLDFFNDDHNLIVDLKTSADASYSAFSRSVHDYRYHCQDAMYSDGAKRCGLKSDGFVFVAVEKTPPFLVACYALTPEWRDQGRAQYRRDLDTYFACKEADHWPGYDELRDLEKPRYAEYVPIY